MYQLQMFEISVVAQFVDASAHCYSHDEWLMTIEYNMEMYFIYI
jgi:hypothetical protein